MTKVVEIEEAIRQLPQNEQWELVNHLADDLWARWDQQIDSDSKSGKLDHLVSEVRNEVKSGQTRPLDEIINNP